MAENLKTTPRSNAPATLHCTYNCNRLIIILRLQ